MEKKQSNILHRVLWAYRDWLISTQAKCDSEWSSCLKKIFNDHNKKEIRVLRNYLYIQRQLPMEDRNPFDPDLQFLVGVAYLCGWIPRNNAVEEAHRWFQRSADLGSPRGMMAVGYLHEKHLGKYRDENYMLSYYSMAANKGYAPAQLRLTSYEQLQWKKAEISRQMLQTSLNSMWTEMQAAEEEFREQLQQLQQETEKYLNRISAAERSEAEEFMSVLFKGDWRNPARLCDASCDYLVDAHVLMKAADKLGITNYCGIVVTAVSALEHECRRRFYDAFDSYLGSIGVEAQDRKTRMGLKGEHFTLGSVGSVTYSTDYDDFSRTTKLLSPAAQSIRRKQGWTEAKMIFGYGFPGTWDPVRKQKKTFINMVLDLAKDYRNPAAHAEKVMTSEDAARCCDLLGITEAHKKQAELAVANEKMNNITGALKALLWLTAPLEQKE